MAGFLQALKLVPWTKIIVAAPVIASEARKFWTDRRGNGKRPGTDEQVERLRKELTTASELITRLADQHRILVDAIAVLQARTFALVMVSAVLSVAVIGLAIAVAVK